MCRPAYNARVNEPLTLRERNRREAWLAIHNAAADLALKHGLALTTVEMIADRAGVSRRTFFNYFASKEDAILGVQEIAIPDDALREFRTDKSSSLLERTVTLMAAMMRSTTPEPEIEQRRSELVEALPALHNRMRRFALSAEELLEPVLREELAAKIEGDGEVQALLMLAGTILRYAYRRDPRAVTGGDDRSIRTAISTFRDAAGAHA